MSAVLASREERGRAIAETPNQVTRVDDDTYWVRSQSVDGEYEVLRSELGWVCACPDHIYRGVKCKHVWAVEFSRAVRRAVEARTVVAALDTLACPFCRSNRVVKNALRHNRYGMIQRYLCRACDKRFSHNLGFERMRGTPEAISSAMQLYFTGESLRNVQKFLRLRGVVISHVAVYKWIRKYVALVQSYVETLRPQVSETWRADELWVKIRGNMKYLFALMDDETRFWIAQQVTESKHTVDVRPLLRQAMELTGKKPQTFITDGLYSFHHACRKEFWGRRRKGVTQHVRHIRLQGDRNNNRMERLNGEIRDREKVVRGVKKPDSPLLTGYRLYHNFLRPHEALDGKTPAEMAGIRIEGDNKWLTLIQNATRHPRVNTDSADPKS